jgi:lipoprotein-releasing system permease protein
VTFEWFIALRYLREGRSQTALILGAVSIGVAVLVFLSALISGLQTSLIAQTLGSQAHVVVRPVEAAARALSPVAPTEVAVVHAQKPLQHLKSIEQWQQLLLELRGAEGVTAASPSVAGSALVMRGAITQSVALRGVDPETFPAIVDVGARLVAGQFRLAGADVLIGAELASKLGLAVGDKLRIVASGGRADVFTIAGIFDLGAKDVNERWVLVPLRAAQTLLDLVGGVTTIELKVARIFDAERIAAELESRTGLDVDSWMKTNAQLLVGLRSQDSSKTMIQFFVTVTVALGIASVLIVSVVQKTREIGIMRAVGASRRRVLRVFLIQGGLVGSVGALLGDGLGALMALGFERLAKGPDGAPQFPVDLNLPLFVGATALATAVGLGSAVAPARRAARLDPAEVMRHG